MACLSKCVCGDWKGCSNFKAFENFFASTNSATLKKIKFSFGKPLCVYGTHKTLRNLKLITVEVLKKSFKHFGKFHVPSAVNCKKSVN